MKHALALAIACACSAPAAHKPSRLHRQQPMSGEKPPAEVVQVPHPEPPPIATIHGKTDAVEAPHGGMIQMIAVSPGGGVALTADELGGIRLWPALDGSQEPRVLRMPLAKQLAIATRVDGYTAVARDDAGGLYLAKLDLTGRMLAHSVLSPDPPFVDVIATNAGLLARRADQTIALLDADGGTIDRIATEPGQRLLALAVADKRVITIIDRDGKRRARWLELGPKLAWGAWLDLGTDLTGTNLLVALSPSGNRIATTVRDDKNQDRGAVFDVATKKSTSLGTANLNTLELGFVDDAHLAIDTFSGVAWIDLATSAPTLAQAVGKSTGFARIPDLFAVTPGRVVSAQNGELVLATPTGTPMFLGYDLVSPRIAEVGPNGQLLVAVGDKLAFVDKELRVVPMPPIALKTPQSIVDMRWLGADDWLVELGNAGAIEIALVSSTSTSTKTIYSALPETQVLHYEPSTHIATMSFGATSEVARFDPSKRSLDRIASLKKPSPYEQVLLVPVSPKLARGTQLVQISMRDKSTIKWLKDARALDKPSATAVVDGPFAGADAAGNVYMWRQNAGRLELAVYADGKVVRTLPNNGPVTLWPEPAGPRVMQTGQTSVALFDGNGKQLWMQPLGAAQEALWLSDGAVAVTSAAGIARIDAATGAITAARCGWGFSLSAKPHPAMPRIEPLCAQVAH